MVTRGASMPGEFLSDEQAADYGRFTGSLTRVRELDLLPPVGPLDAAAASILSHMWFPLSAPLPVCLASTVKREGYHGADATASHGLFGSRIEGASSRTRELASGPRWSSRVSRVPPY